MEKKCIRCGKILIPDFQEYLKNYPEEKEIGCHYCGYVEKIQND